MFYHPSFYVLYSFGDTTFWIFKECTAPTTLVAYTVQQRAQASESRCRVKPSWTFSLYVFAWLRTDRFVAVLTAVWECECLIRPVLLLHSLSLAPFINGSSTGGSASVREARLIGAKHWLERLILPPSLPSGKIQHKIAAGPQDRTWSTPRLEVTVAPEQMFTVRMEQDLRIGPKVREYLNVGTRMKEAQFANLKFQTQQKLLDPTISVFLFSPPSAFSHKILCSIL